MSTDTAKLVLYNDKQGHEQFGRLWQWAKPRLQAGQRLWISIKPAKRSMEQNAMFWSILTDLSEQCRWAVDGQMVHLPPEDVKHILTAGLKRHQRMARGIDGGLVILGQSTSRMTKSEMSDLITLAHAVGDGQGVKWSRTSLGRDVPDEVAA